MVIKIKIKIKDIVTLYFMLRWIIKGPREITYIYIYIYIYSVQFLLFFLPVRPHKIMLIDLLISDPCHSEKDIIWL